MFADLALSRRLERQEALGGMRFIDARRRIETGSGACWTEIAGATLLFDGVSSPITQTFGLGLLDEPSAGDLDRIEAFFRERGAPVFHEVSPLAGVPLADLLASRGYRPVEFTSVMYKPLAAYVSTRGDSRVTVRIARPGEEDLWSQVSARGWSENPEWTDFLLALGRVIASAEGAHAFFAELDGSPIATGVLRCEDSVAYFGGASTIPEARKQGAQRALLDARMKFAIEHGCDLAMMCAHCGSASQRNAEREGFRIAYTRTKWGLQ
jgi:GNAT superfamily N-acetyltransferase